MRIYTSYFAKCRKIPDDIVKISIASKPPNGYNGVEYKQLAPKSSFFFKWKENHDNDYYIRCFSEQVLDKLIPEDVYKDFQSLGNGKDVVLLCYEKPENFCHRHLVAKWLSYNLGIKIEEWSET